MFSKDLCQVLQYYFEPIFCGFNQLSANKLLAKNLIYFEKRTNLFLPSFIRVPVFFPALSGPTKLGMMSGSNHELFFSANEFFNKINGHNKPESLIYLDWFCLFNLYWLFLFYKTGFYLTFLILLYVPISQFLPQVQSIPPIKTFAAKFSHLPSPVEKTYSPPSEKEKKFIQQSHQRWKRRGEWKKGESKKDYHCPEAASSIQ